MRIPSSKQGWTKKAERIRCPAPLPENSVGPLLMRMLVPAPYQAPVKKDNKKKKKEEEGPSDAMSGEADAQSSHKDDGDTDEEEEVEDPPRKGKKKGWPPKPGG